MNDNQKPSSKGLEIAQDTMQKLMRDFECDVETAECGAKCCSNILLLTQKEIDRIRNYVRRNKIKPFNRNNVLKQEYVDVCPFLNPETLRCSIYSKKPYICEHFTCNIYKKGEKRMPDYRRMKPVNMLLTFFPEEYCPPVPNLEQLEAEFKRKKKMIYG